MNCWYCRADMIWQSDFTYEDYGRQGEGMVAILLCSECNASAEFSISDEEPEDKDNEA